MGSIAFWQERNINTTQEPNVVMNFNLWSHCGEGTNSFLDVGFKIFNILSASKYNLYIPFGKETDINDLALRINNSKIIGAIFNEMYSVTDLPGTDQFWPVKDEAKGETAFIIYRWDDHTGNSAVKVKRTDADEGLLITIDTRIISEQIKTCKSEIVTEDCAFYFRFRTYLSNTTTNSSLIRCYKPKNTFLQSTFATTFIVDFRFNDIRSLPEGISNVILKASNSFVNVEKLHFFLMTKAHVDVETGDKEQSIRELELNTWDEYVENKFDIKDIVAYHCSKKEKVLQWELFAKLRVNNSTLSVLGRYLFALGAITVILNIISNLICKLLGI